LLLGTGPVLDDERLPKPLRQRLTDQARDDVGRAAGAEPSIRCTGRVG
jgi:hypothetical protein